MARSSMRARTTSWSPAATSTADSVTSAIAKARRSTFNAVAGVYDTGPPPRRRPHRGQLQRSPSSGMQTLLPNVVISHLIVRRRRVGLLIKRGHQCEIDSVVNGFAQKQNPPACESNVYPAAMSARESSPLGHFLAV